MRYVIYKENYKVYENGAIFSIKQDRFITIINANKGYLNVKINGKTIRHHRVVAECFVPNNENKPQINHINGIKTDNRASNLEWCTNKENSEHAWANGLMSNIVKASNSQSIEHRRRSSETVIARCSKLVLHTTTGIFYDSAKDAANYLGIKYSTFKTRINSKSLNNTNCIYV
jgi:hypothetical protein